MSIKNRNKQRDLIFNDLQMMKICIDNLSTYFAKDEEKMNILRKIDEDMEKIVSNYNSI
jgi:hypothetical protein